MLVFFVAVMLFAVRADISDKSATRRGVGTACGTYRKA